MNKEEFEKIIKHTIYDDNMHLVDPKDDVSSKVVPLWRQKFEKKLDSTEKKSIYCSIWSAGLSPIRIYTTLYFKHLIDLGFKVYIFKADRLIETKNTLLKRMELDGISGVEDVEKIKSADLIYSYEDLLKIFRVEKSKYKILDENYFNKSYLASPDYSNLYFSYLYSLKMDLLWNLGGILEKEDLEKLNYFREYHNSFLEFYCFIKDVFFAYVLSNSKKEDIFILGAEDSLIYNYCIDTLSKLLPEEEKQFLPVPFPHVTVPRIYPSDQEKENWNKLNNYFISNIFFGEIDEVKIRNFVSKLDNINIARIIYLILKFYEDIKKIKLGSIEPIKYYKSSLELMNKDIDKENLINLATNGLVELFENIKKDLKHKDLREIKKMDGRLLIPSLIDKPELFDIIQVIYIDYKNKKEENKKEETKNTYSKHELMNMYKAHSKKEVTDTAFSNYIKDLKKYGYFRNIITKKGIYQPNMQKIKESFEALEELGYDPLRI